jgi:signal transduction histidine kinase
MPGWQFPLKVKDRSSASLRWTAIGSVNSPKNMQNLPLHMPVRLPLRLKMRACSANCKRNFRTEKLIEELENKNAELERFTYTVSHDLKSPLITIKGFLGFLEQDAARGNFVRLRNDIQRIADATDKMQTLLNELLELSRIGRLVNPHQTGSFCRYCSRSAGNRAGTLACKSNPVMVQEGLPDVYGDRQRLIEVLQNLIDNAAKFFGPHSGSSRSGRMDTKMASRSSMSGITAWGLTLPTMNGSSGCSTNWM